MSAERREVPPLALMAGVVLVGALAVAPAAAAPGVALGVAVAFAGSRRLALVVVIVVSLCGVAGLTVAASERSAPAGSGTRR